MRPVDQGKVHAVCAFVEYQSLRARPLYAVGGVAEDEHRYLPALAEADGQIHHRAAVCVDQYSGHSLLPFFFFLPFSVV